MWNSTRVSAFAWIFLFFLAQNSLTYAFPSEIFPLLVIGVLFYALSEGPWFGFWIGCYAGFFLDLLGVGRMGHEMMLLGGIGWTAGWAASTFFRDSWVTQVFFPPAANAAFFLLNHWVGPDFYPQDEIFFTTIFMSGAEWRSCFLTIVLSPFIFRFLKSVSFTRRERGLRWR